MRRVNVHQLLLSRRCYWLFLVSIFFSCSEFLCCTAHCVPDQSCTWYRKWVNRIFCCSVCSFLQFLRKSFFRIATNLKHWKHNTLIKITQNRNADNNTPTVSPFIKPLITVIKRLYFFAFQYSGILVKVDRYMLTTHRARVCLPRGSFHTQETEDVSARNAYRIHRRS